jgi:hypothetical protein
MKKLFTLIIACLLTTLSFAQEVRPDKPVDDPNIDNFVNSAFDLSDKKNNYPKLMTAINDTLTILKSAPKLDPAIYDALDVRIKAIQDGYERVDKDLEALSAQGEDMINNATKISPPTKVIRATKNVKSAVATIAETRKGIPADIQTATTLRARFEKMKALNETKQ